jgi:hypothetical protein
MKHSTLCEELATSIFKEFSGNESSKKEAVLLILDRRLDPVTPILNQVKEKFQTMLNLSNKKERKMALWLSYCFKLRVNY